MKRRWRTVGVVSLVLVTLASVLVGLWIHRFAEELGESIEQIEEDVILPIGLLYGALVTYYEERSEWPTEVEQLREFEPKRSPPFHELAGELDKFESLAFRVLPTGNLEVEYVLKQLGDGSYELESGTQKGKCVIRPLRQNTKSE